MREKVIHDLNKPIAAGPATAPPPPHFRGTHVRKVQLAYEKCGISILLKNHCMMGYVSQQVGHINNI